MRCTNCRTENPEGARYCGFCGSSLAGRFAEPQAELRQLTGLFCDLVGSTSLAESLDPEDLRDVTSAYQPMCERVIQKHDGHIAQYLGDGVLVYFGYPTAHDDDGRRAVRTGLEIIVALVALSTRLQRQ